MRYPDLQIPTHSWLKQITIAHVPGPSTGLSDQVASALVRHFRQEGHSTPETPTPETDVILTTARLGEALGWRDSLMFTARRRYLSLALSGSTAIRGYAHSVITWRSWVQIPPPKLITHSAAKGTQPGPS